MYLFHIDYNSYACHVFINKTIAYERNNTHNTYKVTRLPSVLIPFFTVRNIDAGGKSNSHMFCRIIYFLVYRRQSWDRLKVKE